MVLDSEFLGLLLVCFSLLLSVKLQVANYEPPFIGSAAAAFQSVAFGAFTPAGGIFAGLTSMAMTGLYPVFAFVLAGVIAMVMAVIAKIVQRQARA